jgi:hypothetical protein
MSKNQLFDQQGHLIEETETINNLYPDVTAFITQMMLNDGYQKIVLSGHPAKIARLETLMIRLETRTVITKADLEIIKLIWNDLMNELPDKQKYIGGWNQLAAENFIPFTFNSNANIEIDKSLD